MYYLTGSLIMTWHHQSRLSYTYSYVYVEWRTTSQLYYSQSQPPTSIQGLIERNIIIINNSNPYSEIWRQNKGISNTPFRIALLSFLFLMGFTVGWEGWCTNLAGKLWGCPGNSLRSANIYRPNTEICFGKKFLDTEIESHWMSSPHMQ